MIDELVKLLGLAAVDVAQARLAKRSRWIRAVSRFGGLLFLMFVAGLIYVTVRYS
jgi:hypothetical protein